MPPCVWSRRGSGRKPFIFIILATFYGVEMFTQMLNQIALKRILCRTSWNILFVFFFIQAAAWVPTIITWCWKIISVLSMNVHCPLCVWLVIGCIFDYIKHTFAAWSESGMIIRFRRVHESSLLTLYTGWRVDSRWPECHLRYWLEANDKLLIRFLERKFTTSKKFFKVFVFRFGSSVVLENIF